MKTKLVLTILASVALSAGFVLQVKTASAYITSQTPITSPITYFAISGRVGYKVYSVNFPGQILPAKGALVTTRNTQSNEKKVATTSATGSYTILVTPGAYSVSASDSKGTQFKPMEYILNIVSSDVSKINFLGIIR